MSRSSRRIEAWRDIVLNHTKGEETREELRRISKEYGLFDEDEMATVIRKYQDAIIRRLARSVRIDLEGGEQVELVSIKRPSKAGGKTQNLYVQLSFLAYEENVQLIDDQLTRSDYFKTQAKRYYDHGCRKFGEPFQKEFNFNSGC